MSELLVTQCPHCQTRFRLTAEQLSVAAGHVRCGACLEVFHAVDAAAALARVTTKPEAQANWSNLLHDDLDEPDLAALGLDESIIGEINPARMADEPHTEQPFSRSSTGSSLDLHEDFLATPPAQDFGANFDHNRTGLHTFLSEEGYADRDIHPSDITQATSGEAAEEQPASPPQEQPATAPLADEAQPTDKPGYGMSEPDFTEPEALRPEPRVTPLRLEMLEEELLAEPPVRRRSSSWLWTCLTLLALLALPTQYLYYHFDALARDQRSRPLLESVCLLVRCELPARVDISRIRSTNLLVRPHPEFPNALAIDVILYNRADFEQPFPVLEMQFDDATGRRLTSRRFRPEEYLSGELAGITLMPSQTPIHVGLSMLDPGPQAHGYRLDFLSP